jgi:gliding motility-associated-like protein
VVGIMPFFTPNQDSYNDFWQIVGIGKKFNSKSKVQIFDRFGKLLYEIQSGDDQGWDGTLNGSPLPADDYWFTLSLEDGRVASGHFSLKR